MQAATPRPWHTGFHGNPDPQTHFEGANGRPIGTTGGFQDSHHSTKEENEANAALIVRAVNAYDDMLAALRLVEHDLLGEHGPNGQNLYALSIVAEEAVRQAITKAIGGQQ